LNTIGDVAKRAGVSTVTVSRVINGANNVSPLTRQKVERAIKELNYVPSVAARSLRSRRTQALALLVPDITNPFWTTVARGVEDAAQKGGYSLLLCNTDENAAKQQHYIDVMISQRVDGVIIAPCHSNAAKLKRLRDRSIPTVVLDRRVEGWQVDTVISDSISGARALVKYLISLGHQRIAVLSGPKHTSSAEDRVIGYHVALAESGIPFDKKMIYRGEFKVSSGVAMMEQLLERSPRPTAIFATNNSIAMGAIEAMNRQGLNIPQDLALVCFDDIPYLSYMLPFLTVVAQPVYELGVQAAQLLLCRLGGKVDSPPSKLVLPTSLVIRYSCGGRNHDLCLPLMKDAQPEERIQVIPLSAEEQRHFSELVPELKMAPIWAKDERR
jgi:LacI family transcriptional regulator